MKKILIMIIVSISMQAAPQVGECIDMGTTINGYTTGAIIVVGPSVSDNYINLPHNPGSYWYRNGGPFSDNGYQTYQFGYLESANYNDQALYWELTGYYYDIRVNPNGCNSDPCSDINPSPPSGYDFISEFSELTECEQYMQFHLLNNYSCEPKSPECPGVFGYADTSGPCSDIIPPPTLDGYPYRGTYPNITWCQEAIKYLAVDGLGICKVLPPCSRAFAFFNAKDNTPPVTPSPEGSDNDPSGPLPQPGDKPDLNPYKPNPDLGYNPEPDDNNDTVNLNPLIGALGESSNRNHDDLSNLNDNIGYGFDNLSGLISGLGDKLSSIYNWLSGSGTTTPPDTIDTNVSIPAKKDLFDLNSPDFNVDIQTQNPACSLNAVIWGRNIEFTICPFEQQLSTFGTIMLSLAYLTAFVILFVL